MMLGRHEVLFERGRRLVLRKVRLSTRVARSFGETTVRPRIVVAIVSAVRRQVYERLGRLLQDS